ncbi:MAG: RNA polymerase sigma factor [Myxococcota bacterium]
MDDQDDLLRATRGDRSALRRVVDRWIPKIRRWAFVFCGDPTAAEDAVQESLVRLLRFISRYDPARPFGPWLKMLVRNACRTELARRGRTEDREVSNETAESAAPSRLDRTLDLARAVDHVHAAFQLLSPRQREIFDLVDLQGLTPTEASRELGLSAGAVRAQLAAARRALRERLTADLLPLLRDA